MKFEESIKGHHCQLRKEYPEKVPLCGKPKSEFFKRLKIMIQMLRLVSRNHPKTTKVFKSTAAINVEKARQIISYPHVIHPFSDFRSVWDIFMAIFLWVSFIMVPLHVVFTSHLAMVTPDISSRSNHLWLLRGYFLLIDLVLNTDVLLNFMTGYFKESTQDIYLGCGKIARNYIKHCFILDVVSGFPVDYTIFMLVGIDTERSSYYHVPVLSSLLLHLRLPSLIRYTKHLHEVLALRFNENYIRTTIINSLATLLLFLHWTACMHYLVTAMVEGFIPDDWDKNSWFVRTKIDKITGWQLYFECTFKAVSNTFCIGFGRYRPRTMVDMACTMLTSVLGITVAIYIIVQIMVITRISNSANAKYEEMIMQLMEYMHHKKLPPALKQRLLTYYKFCFQKSYFREGQILDSISGQLREDLLMHSCRRLVENVNFFHDIPDNLMRRIVSCLKWEVLLANDVVMKFGTPGDSMYFISSGTVAIYTATGKEVCHLQDGAHFGEIALVMEDEKRVASVVVVETCEFYVLSRADFHEAVAPYPDLLRRIQITATERLLTNVLLEKLASRRSTAAD